MKNEADRRSFLFGTTKAAGAAALTGAAAAGLAACPPVEVKTWPYTYVPLDVELVRKMGHQSYYAGGCCYGAFDAIVRALRDAVGAPYDTIATDMMRFGGGGVGGFGSLCGALNGSCAAIGLVSDKATQTKLVQELLSWYAATPLPTDISNQYAQNGEFLVDEIRTSEVLVQSVAGGNLCHMSVTNWCYASGFNESDTQRLERCARLTGDVAAKTAELLNAQHAGTFVSENAFPSAQASCASCHVPETETALTQTNGKMDCDLCHAPHPLQ